jgi:FtsP/CotA-like multicopper oxidase with cupredoxin domain
MGCPPDAAGDRGLLEQPKGWDANIRVAEAVDVNADDGVVEVRLIADLTEVQLTEGAPTVVWAYNGQVPGPTIRAKRGDRVIVHLDNALPEPTTIHWHGLRVVAEMDGTELMQTPVAPGETFTYVLDLKDAGTYWYHPHINSGAQLGYGLYGAFVVSDDEEPALGDDLVLVLSDMSLDGDNQLKPGDDQGWFGDFFGRQGSLSLTNGRVEPRLKARVGVPQRWRVINASRSKYHQFRLPDDDVALVGVDGGLLATPVADAVVMLPPGARAELRYVASKQGEGKRRVQNEGVDIFHTGSPPEGNVMMVVEVVTKDAVTPPALPKTLRDIDALSVSGAREQEVRLDTALGADGLSYYSINGVLGHGEPFVAQTNTVELWTLRNNTTQDHPFHLHGFFFQVLDLNGVAPETNGWLDTVNLEPEDVMRIAISIDERAGDWMFHCHILDHADAGMMRTLRVVEDLSAVTLTH